MNDRDQCPPEPPRLWRAPTNPIKNNQGDAARDQRDHETDQLFDKPRPESLGGESVLMFAKEQLIEGEGKTQHCYDQNVANRIYRHLNGFGIRRALGEIAQPGRPFRCQQKNSNGSTQKKIPKNKPIAAFEISVGFRTLVCANGIQPRFGRSNWTERLCRVDLRRSSRSRRTILTLNRSQRNQRAQAPNEN